jgi:hypothetical protein
VSVTVSEDTVVVVVENEAVSAEAKYPIVPARVRIANTPKRCSRVCERK